MKKGKSLLLLAGLLIVGLFNLPLLSAASNRVEIVTRAKQYVFKNANGGHVGILRQEIVEQDLVNGNLTIELTLNNAKTTEIYYILNKSNSATTISNFKTLTENIFNNYGTTYTKIGAILVSDSIVSSELYQTVSEVGSTLDNLGKTPATTGETLNNAVKTAKENFSNVENKVIVIVDETNTAANVMSSITEDLTGINVITYTTTAATLTNAASVANVNDATVAVGNTLIPAKNNMTIALPFASYITNNFDVTLVGNPTDATLDANTKTINWNLGNVAPNEVKTLRYKLELKSVIDESIIGLNLILNEAPTIVFNGITVANTEANECSPVIKVLAEAVDNPKTGIANYVIFGSISLVIGGITFVTARKALKKI